MFVRTVMLANYRSLNYDYKKWLLAKDDFPAVREPWENETDYSLWRPWLQVPIHAPISCVVGANESGKSLLLQAVVKVLSGKEFSIDDSCRYREKGDVGDLLRGKHGPKIGLEFERIDSTARQALNEVLRAHGESSQQDSADTAGPAVATEFDRFALISDRESGPYLLFFPTKGASPVTLRPSAEEIATLRAVLPTPVELKSDVELPPRADLLNLAKASAEILSEEERNNWLSKQGKVLFPDKASFDRVATRDSDRLVAQLLRQFQGIDHTAICELRTMSSAVLKDLSGELSEKLEERINIGHWWGQDIDVQMGIDLLGDGVQLNLTDRTRRWYAFQERSQGMKYFLGYILQVMLALKSRSGPILFLSDEPDFRLSAVGQRDLSRFFRKIIAARETGAAQLIYTTHSPELIDPNYPNRISILRKGLFDEGTSVVAKSCHRLFEPVRSALGTRVTSIPFIDGANLVVEGISDLTFVVRMSQYLAQRGKPYLDLSGLSVVVSEGTKRLSRIISAAKSLAGDRAYLTILLDNDAAGRRAAEEAKALDTHLAQSDQVITVDRVLESGLGKDLEIEDLIPYGICYEALRAELHQAGVDALVSGLPQRESFVASAETRPVIDVISECLASNTSEGGPFELDKTQFIEQAFDLLESLDDGDEEKVEFERNLQSATMLLLDKVNDNLRNKRHEEIRRTIGHLTDEFLGANPIAASKSRALVLLDEIRALGAKVSLQGQFDKHVDSFLSEFSLRSGQKTDEIQAYTRFRSRLKQLPQLLTIDTSLRFV